MLGIIINPMSGTRAFRLQRLYLWRLLKQRHEPFRYCVTKYENHALEIARDLVEAGYDELLVIGGDGTFSEVINGVMMAAVNPIDKQKIRLGLMPRGTGNDWGRYWNLNRSDWKQAIERFFSGEDHPLDVGCLTYWRNGVEEKRYFVNSIGFGVDSLCCSYAEKLKKYVGSHASNYFFGLLRAITALKPIHIRLEADGQLIADDKLFTMTIANGPFSGGGIQLNPTANPTDGIFQGMFLRPVTFSNVREAVPVLFNGKITDLDFVYTFEGREFVINSRAYFMVECDGILQHFMGPCKVTCIHHALNFRV